MAEKQFTLKQEITLEGVGLHTGASTRMRILPADTDSWFVFRRVDLEGTPEIKANVDFVSTTQRGTSLKNGDAEVHTTEHILAALYGMGVDNAVIELDGPEVPIMDGSSKDFVRAIEEVGLVEQDADRVYFELDENLIMENDDCGAEFLAIPHNDYRLTVMVDYHSPLLGTQHASLRSIENFKTEIAESRTFVFVRELIQLVEAGLIKGGDVDNAIVMMDRQLSDSEKSKLAETFNKPAEMLEEVGIGILNNLELRSDNEPARHKLLDIVGDLALVGMRIRAHVLAARPGHSCNVAFAKELKKEWKKQQKAAPKYDPREMPVYDNVKVQEILPHRYPFCLVDKVIDLVPNDYVVGIKNVTRNEEFFNGHFPTEPVMPGVLIVEALAQTGGLMVLAGVDNPEEYSTYFMKVDGVKFKRKVVPGDTLIMHVELMAPIRRGIGQLKATAFVGDTIVAEGELMAQIAKNK